MTSKAIVRRRLPMLWLCEAFWWLRSFVPGKRYTCGECDVPHSGAYFICPRCASRGDVIRSLREENDKHFGPMREFGDVR